MFNSERKVENIVVALVSVVGIILLLVFVGFDGIVTWLRLPIVWSDPEYINLMLVDKEIANEKMTLTFLVENQSSNDIETYEFYTTLEREVLEMKHLLYADIEPYSVSMITKTIANDGKYKRLFEKIKDRDVEEIDFSWHAKTLSVDGEDIVKNTGTVKTILLLLISLISGVLVFADCATATWLRVLLKFLMVPGILAIAIVAFIFFALGSSAGSGVASAAASRKKKAAKNYAREVNLKAGALAHGNTKEAAFAQARMDRHMADMISDAPSSAKAEYKRQANLKAGALAHGNTKEAAKSQAEMDRLMAKMISKK